ncbi:phosphate ABC transporter permease subunit PstC [Halobaculum sp. MBLA0143]|uniref:phosphate ABC transporter permease subunit PstC n=1 Tax=Halobaculum sp. MBLA0143 TaxID=3079933 RepID=UPI0035248279
MATTEIGRRIADVDVTDRGAVLQAVGGLSLVATLVLFLLNSSLTAVPLLVTVSTVVYGWGRHQATTARALTFVATVSTVLVLGLIAVFVFVESIPAARAMSDTVLGVSVPGLGMLTKTSEPFWAARDKVFSMVPMIYGTVVTTLLAVSIAGPLGIAGALFIAEIAPDWAREVVKPGVEILAGIPSIVYGFIGFVVINQYTFDVLGTSYGSLFSVGLVIGLMSLPTVVTVAEDAIDSVPDSMKSGSLAVGATDWQTMKSVTLPAAFSGITAAVLLGVGRALGETMAATVMLGHSQNLPAPLYDVFFNGETLTSVIASQYGNATETQLSALYGAGVILFATVAVISVVSQLVEWRMKRNLEGDG